MSPLRVLVLVVAAAAVSAVATASVMLLLRRNPVELGTGATPVLDFALLDQDGRFHQLYQHAKARAIVLYTHGAGCPIVRNTLPALRELRAGYRGKGVEVWLINANPQDDREALKREAALLDIDAPILKDDSQLVMESLGVTRTGEAILVDPTDWTIRYRGPIDDRVQYGSERPMATKRYLKDAIDALLDGRRITVTTAPGAGCLIDMAQSAGGVRPVSYETDVVPVLRQKCVPCHRQGGIGPWSMDSYEALKGWSAMMREVIMNKRMPPWHADPSIGTFSPDLSLSVGEQRTLVRWVQNGAPRAGTHDPLAGDGAGSVDEWPLGAPDVVIDLPEQEIPARGLVPYRWLKIPVPIERDTWVRAAHLRPGNRTVLHHGFVFVQYPEGLKRLEPDWLEGLNGFFVASVPGAEVMPFPEGSGQRLPAGATLVFQLHYVPVGHPTTDRSKLALYFHRQPPALEYRVASVSNMKIRIPPRAPDHEERAEAVLKERVSLHALYPHMHYRGSRFRFEARYPDGRSEALLSVPNYNTSWQTVYHLAAPKEFPAGTRIVVNAAFDNSESNRANPDPSKEVRWGLSSQDEMLVGYFMYTRPREAQAVPSTPESRPPPLTPGQPLPPSLPLGAK